MYNIPQMLDFLVKLKENNTREWVMQNKALYDRTRSDFRILSQEIIDELSAFDQDLQGLEAKQCVFRLNKDLRFAKEKTPYKTMLGASIKKNGRKSIFAGYYLHIEPEGRSFFGGGIYAPLKPELDKIRQEIDYNAEAFEAICRAPEFVRYFGALQGEELKTPPKGYDKNHPLIAVIRKKSFLMMSPIRSEMLSTKDFKAEVLPVFKAMIPLNRFINQALAEQES